MSDGPHRITRECTNCGVCVSMCPTDAIKEAKRQHVISKRRCDGCGVCVPFCPLGAIEPAESPKADTSYADELAAALGRPPK